MVAIGNGLSSLQSLDVSFCRKLTDKGLSAVAEGCPDLQSLHLARCRFVTDGLLGALSKNCHKLEQLGLYECSNITDAGLMGLVTGCRGIRFLDTNECNNIGDIGVSSVAKACSSSLKRLKLLDCDKIGDVSILNLARFCNNLESLNVGGCRNISDESIKSVAIACKNSLKNLRMDYCLNISDSSLRCIFTECVSLETLNIGCCEKVTDIAFEGLSSREPELTLKVLKVSNCTKITVAGLRMLLDKCASLVYLDVRSCPQITEAGCSEAGLQFPNCCIVNFIQGGLIDPC